MATKTNDFKLSFAVEASLGVLPGTPEWFETDRTSIDTWGATINTDTIAPINQNAMDEKDIVTGVDSAVGYSNNLTISAFKAHAQGAFRSDMQTQEEVIPTAVTASGYTHAAISGAIAQGSLIYARNLSDSTNNGLFVVNSGSTTTNTSVTTTLLAESSIASNARFNVVGVQGDTGDIEIDSDNNIISTTLDFTGLDINVGQSLWIGGSTTATQFATADYTGLVRVKLVETNKITIDERPWTIGAADAGATKTIQLFFGDFIRNVPRGDFDYNPESYTFEGEFPNMESDATNYEYPNGNRVNTCSLAFSQRDKATVAWNFMGLNTPAMSASQESGNRNNYYDNQGFGTSSDCVQLKVKDSSKIDYTTTFTNFTIDINNNITPRPALCTEYAVDINDGNFGTTGNISAFIVDLDMINAVRNNSKITIDYAVENEDGILDFYLPSATLSDKTYEMNENDNMILSCTYKGYRDSFYNFILGTTMFHYLPI